LPKYRHFSLSQLFDTFKTHTKPPRFSLGNVYCTKGAREALNFLQVNPLTLIGRHISGDWGSVSSEDALSNERALRDGSRILSAYELASSGESIKIWLITEADRSATTILLPSEY